MVMHRHLALRPMDRHIKVTGIIITMVRIGHTTIEVVGLAVEIGRGRGRRIEVAIERIGVEIGTGSGIGTMGGAHEVVEVADDISLSVFMSVMARLCDISDMYEV